MYSFQSYRYLNLEQQAAKDMAKMDGAVNFKTKSFQKFWKGLYRAPGGRRIRKNLLQDEGIPGDAREEFVDRVTAAVEGGAIEPISVMTSAVMTNPGLTLRGRSPVINKSCDLARLDQLVSLNRELAKTTGGGYRDLESLYLDIKAGVVTVKDLLLSNRIGILWCTLAESIDECISAGDKVARIRDKLGLRYLYWGHVYMFRYPASRPGTLRVPTTLDAVDYADFIPSQVTDLTGYTKDLRTGKPSMLELVHEARNFSDLCDSFSELGIV
jgi:hypothetical protein